MVTGGQTCVKKPSNEMIKLLLERYSLTKNPYLPGFVYNNVVNY